MNEHEILVGNVRGRDDLRGLFRMYSAILKYNLYIYIIRTGAGIA
jgi:hypothetical protein